MILTSSETQQEEERQFSTKLKKNYFIFLIKVAGLTDGG